MGCSTSKSTQVVEKEKAKEELGVIATAADEPPKASEQPKPKEPGAKGTVVTPASTGPQTDLPIGPDGQPEKPDISLDERLSPDTVVVFVLGGPGSGKGTQCEKIVEKYGFQHLSAGDLLRAEVKSQSDLGQQLEETMREGKLVPTAVTVKLLRKAMLQSEKHTFLIDGFPRALDQAEVFEKDLVPCKLVIFFDLDEDTMRSRLLKRGETSGRADDNEATISKRFHTFNHESLPVITHYEKIKKVARISAAAPPDAIFEKVQEALDGLGGPSSHHHTETETAGPTTSHDTLSDTAGMNREEEPLLAA